MFWCAGLQRGSEECECWRARLCVGTICAVSVSRTRVSSEAGPLGQEGMESGGGERGQKPCMTLPLLRGRWTAVRDEVCATPLPL